MRFKNKGRVKDKFLDEDDVLKILEFVPEKYRQIYLIAAYSGLRLSNVLYLKWSNIDLAEGWIHVNQSKTGKPVQVPICQKLRSVLNAIKVRPIESQSLIFRDIKSKAVSKAVKRAMVKVGYDWASFHSLRHFCGSFLANNGVRQELIAKVLGHEDLRSTQIYTHFRDQTIKDAIVVFDQPITEEIKKGLAKS